MMSPRKQQNRNGFTLIETLIASVILVIGLASVVGTMRLSRELQVNDQVRRQARSYLQSAVDTIHYDNYSKIPVTNGVKQTISSPVLHTFDDGSVVQGTLSINSTETTNSINGINVKRKTCDLVISWQNPWNSTVVDSVVLRKIVGEI